MAYATDPTQQQQQTNQPGVAVTQPVTTSSAPGAGPSGAKAPTGATSQQAAPQPFTNLQAYLTANAPQVQQQANTISANLTNQYGQVQNDINQGAQAFNQQVAAGYAPDNPQLVQQAAANPTTFVENPSNVQQFESLLNDQYTGPTNFEGTAGYQNLNNEVTQDAANANLVNTPSGLQTYLEGTETNPTPGENLLDTVLLQQNPQAFQQVAAAAAPFSQLPTYLSNAVTTADQAAAAAPTAAQAAQTDIANAFTGSGGIVPTFTNQIAMEVLAAQAQENAYNTAINQNQQTAIADQAALNNAYPGLLQTATAPTANLGNPTTDQAEKAIITNLFSSGNTAALNALQQYLQGNEITTPASAATVATPQQYAENAALTELLGNLYNPPLNPANVSEAGTFSVPSLPGAVPNTGQQVQYEQDLANLFGNVNNPYTTYGSYQTASPETLAAYILKNAGTPGGQYGPALSAADQASLQRLASGETGFS